jgi:anti-sigma factor RsiW
MSHSDIEQLWDDYRDGDLSDEQRAAFEAWLAGNAEAQKRYNAETRWLASLATSGAAPGHDDFAQRTAGRWQQSQTGVIARLRLGAAAQAAAALAAVVAIAALIWFNMEPPAPTPAPMAVMPVEGEWHASPSPVSLLLADADELLAAPPRQIRAAVEQTLSWLDPTRIADVVPVPALHWLEPVDTPKSTDDQNTRGADRPTARSV